MTELEKILLDIIYHLERNELDEVNNLKLLAIDVINKKALFNG